MIISDLGATLRTTAVYLVHVETISVKKKEVKPWDLKGLRKIKISREIFTDICIYVQATNKMYS